MHCWYSIMSVSLLFDDYIDNACNCNGTNWQNRVEKYFYCHLVFNDPTKTLKHCFLSKSVSSNKAYHYVGLARYQFCTVDKLLVYLCTSYFCTVDKLLWTSDMRGKAIHKNFN